jgi:hypothetical protein
VLLGQRYGSRRRVPVTLVADLCLVSRATGVTRHVCANVPAAVPLAVPLGDDELNASTMTPPITPPATAATMQAPARTPVDQDPDLRRRPAA